MTEHTRGEALSVHTSLCKHVYTKFDSLYTVVLRLGFWAWASVETRYRPPLLVVAY